MQAAPPKRSNPLLFTTERLEQEIDPHPPTYSGTPELHGPFGVVYLPSPQLDHISPRWIDWTRNHRHASASVNMAFFSKRLRDAKAEPGHNVWLDFPRRYAKVTITPEEFIIPFQFNETVKVWGAYDYFYRNEYIGQVKHTMPDGQQVPVWCPQEKIERGENKLRKVAGQYTSCAAVNILAYVLGWNCTIFVVGNLGTGGFCDLSIRFRKEWYDAYKKQGRENWTNEKGQQQDPRKLANGQQWAALRKQANATGTEVVHVGGPVDTIPNITEDAALAAMGA